MSNFSLQYPVGVKSSIQNALDQAMQLEQRTCILYYPGTPSPISAGQSVGSPAGTDFSNSVWAGGSPLPISNQYNQPYEGSQNYAQIETTGTIQMVIYPNPSRFSDVFPIGERSPAGLIGVRGYVKDLDNLLNAVRIEIFSDIAQTHFRYKLAGEPVFPGTIIPSRYFYATCERLGG